MTNTDYPFINKYPNETCEDGFEFYCNITRNDKCILSVTRASLGEAVALVRAFLLLDPIVFEGLPRETVKIILAKYKLEAEITLLL